MVCRNLGVAAVNLNRAGLDERTAAVMGAIHLPKICSISDQTGRIAVDMEQPLLGVKTIAVQSESSANYT